MVSNLTSNPNVRIVIAIPADESVPEDTTNRLLFPNDADSSSTVAINASAAQERRETISRLMQEKQNLPINIAPTPEQLDRNIKQIDEEDRHMTRYLSIAAIVTTVIVVALIILAPKLDYSSGRVLPFS